MMKKIKMKKIIVYSVLVLIFCISVAYASINRMLSISGSSEVKQNTWDIHFENIQIVHGSVDAEIEPSVDDNSNTVNFKVNLDLPGDYYWFTIDVVNEGTIDAMTNTVVKTLDLSEEQKKYLDFIVQYQNGDSIENKQLIPVGSYVRLKVRVEYKRDLTEFDLPVSEHEINLAFKLEYVQADDDAIAVQNNGLSSIDVVSGSGSQVGDEICIDTECFYVISSTDTTITMFAKYNLHVGNIYNGSSYSSIENPSGLQDESTKGLSNSATSLNPVIGVYSFTDRAFWKNKVDVYPAYVIDENVDFYQYMLNYKKYLEDNLKIPVNDIRLITIKELESLGCVRKDYSCSDAPSFILSSEYWTGDARSSLFIYTVCNGYLTFVPVSENRQLGIRPVVVIPRNLI